MAFVLTPSHTHAIRSDTQSCSCHALTLQVMRNLTLNEAALNNLCEGHASASRVRPPYPLPPFVMQLPHESTDCTIRRYTSVHITWPAPQTYPPSPLRRTFSNKSSTRNKKLPAKGQSGCRSGWPHKCLPPCTRHHILATATDPCTHCV